MPDDIDIDSFHETYYRMRDAEKVSCVIHLLNSHDITADKLLGPVSGFYSEVFRENTERLDGWIKGIDQLSEDIKHLFLIALWMSGTTQAKQYLQNMVDQSDDDSKAGLQEFVDYEPPDLRMKVPESHVEADMLWGAFFATGDPVFVRNLIEAATYYNNRENYKIFVSAALAKWSLASNAQHHELVLQVLEEALTNYDGTDKEIIKDILYKSKLPFGPHRITKEAEQIIQAKKKEGAWLEYPED